jgi:hypothetical protein
MRTLLLCGLLAPALLFTLTQPSAAQSGTDPRAGAWTLVSADSSLDPPNMLIITREHGAIHVVMSGETHLDIAANPNGHDTPAPGNLGFNQIKLKKIDKRQVDVIESKDETVIATVHEKLSPNGKELVSTTAIVGKADQVTVWARTGGAKVPMDPFAGEWTEDFGKTRLRQNTPLKIEADGSGGVRFVWDFSYTARFDGKPYDLKNSRNDSVTLQLVDPHTVDAVYRRDNQVTQNDRWVVSADGQQMTVTTTGTLETGQKLSEKLTFKK